MLDLNDRVVIVTGAARGIGTVIASLLAEHGAAVAVAAINTADFISRVQRYKRGG